MHVRASDLRVEDESIDDNIASAMSKGRSMSIIIVFLDDSFVELTMNDSYNNRP